MPLAPRRTRSSTAFGKPSFLRGPNLIKVLRSDRDFPNGLVYVLSETADTTLAQCVFPQPVTVQDARDLTLQLTEALKYLHSENLVFCNLKPTAIWRSRATWKLADFSQLRLAGQTDPARIAR